MSGTDRVEYLNGIVTLDLTSIKDEMWYRSALLTPKAKIRSIFWVRKSDDHFDIVCPRDYRDNLIVDLLKYRVNVEVKLEDLTDELPDLCFITEDNQVSGTGSLQGKFIRGGSPSSSEEEFNKELCLNNSCPPHLLFSLNPLEAGLFDAVSLEKGCFLGQEPISRMYNRGRPRFKIALVKVTNNSDFEVLWTFVSNGYGYSVVLFPTSQEEVPEDLTFLGEYPDFKRL